MNTDVDDVGLTSSLGTHQTNVCESCIKGYVSNVITCKLHTSPCRKNVATILLYKIPYVSYVSYVSLDAANICTPVSLAILESILLHGLGKLMPLKPLKPLAILLSTFTTYHYVTAWFC